MSSSRIASRKEWEARFDAELKNDDPKQAWQKLRDHHCDPKALKSALYYAAEHLWLAQQVRWHNSRLRPLIIRVAL
jgi:hypothetical protein